MRLWIVISVTAALFIGWVYVHTDEIPVTFGFLLALAFTLGFSFPRYWAATWVLLALPCPIDEVLVGWFHLPAPFVGGNPLAACVAFAPALLGAAVGRFSRKVH